MVHVILFSQVTAAILEVNNKTAESALSLYCVWLLMCVCRMRLRQTAYYSSIAAVSLIGQTCGEVLLS